jgi:hypothetical protein
VRRPVLLLLSLGLLGLGVVLAISRDSKARDVARPAPAAETAPSDRPTQPPQPGDPRPRRAEPSDPKLSMQWRAELTEKVRGEARPGEAAFAAYADRFVDDNLAMAEAQARAEGLTVPEVRALTRLGLLAMATQRTEDVEEVLGHELAAETRDQLAQMVQDENRTFQDQMRALVAKRAPQEQRWSLIRAADARFRERFFTISGMTAQQLDEMLAGNLLLPGAPGARPDPSQLEHADDTPRGPADTAVPAPRPQLDPR